MTRSFAVLLLLLASFAAHASGGGNSSPPPWEPSNTLRILFAFNKDLQTRERVCWDRNSYWRYCKSTPASYAQEQQDYLNWIFEKQQVNLKIVAQGVGLPRTYGLGEHALGYMLQTLRNQYGARMVMFMMADEHRGSSGACGGEKQWCWSLESMPFGSSPKQTVAHEMGHWLYLGHWPGAALDSARPYAVGHGGGSWVDLMHYRGERGMGQIKYDVFSDHEHECAFWRCGVQNYASAAQALRERWGRYTRPGRPAPPRRDRDGHAGQGRH